MKGWKTMDARIEGLDEDVEELVKVRIFDSTLTCFASVCPYKLEVGRAYPISLEMFIGGEYVVTDAEPYGVVGFERIDESFAYWACGKLTGGVLHVGEIELYDDVLLSDYGHLEGHLVRVRADRLDIEFLRPEAKS